MRVCHSTNRALKSGGLFITAPTPRELSSRRFGRHVDGEPCVPYQLARQPARGRPGGLAALLQHHGCVPQTRTETVGINSAPPYQLDQNTAELMAGPRRIKLPFFDRQSSVLSLDDDPTKLGRERRSCTFTAALPKRVLSLLSYFSMVGKAGFEPACFTFRM